MFDKIIAFFMSIITFFASLFGINMYDNISSYEDIEYGEHENQMFDLYIPEENDGTVGLILMIHGGGWNSGSKDSHTTEMKELASEHGYATATVGYRFLDDDATFNDMLDDIQAAVSKIKTVAYEKGVNIEKMMVMGHSSGAHLALFYAYTRADVSEIEPVAVVDCSGPTDLTNDEYWSYDFAFDIMAQLVSKATGISMTTMEEVEAHKDDIFAVCPIAYVDTAVPTIIAHGKKDKTAPYEDSVELDAALTQAGVKHDFVTFPNADHNLSGDKENKEKLYKLVIEYASAYIE